METLNNSLAETFDVEPQLPVVQETAVIPVSTGDIVEDDAAFARESIYTVLEKGTEAINFTMNILKETQHPRCVEVLGQLLKIQSDNVDKLLKIQKDKKDINDGEGKTGDVNIEGNAIFVGSTHDLLKMIKNEQAKQIVDDSVVSDGK